MLSLCLLWRAGLAQLADTFVSDPRRHFTEGQSVRATVAAVDAARGRFAVSLKPSLVATADGAYLGSLFCALEWAERVRCVHSFCAVHRVLAHHTALPHKRPLSLHKWFARALCRISCQNSCC